MQEPSGSDADSVHYSPFTLSPSHPPHPMTDIIATIGPACAEVETLAEMIRSGMSVARMNFSHGDYAFHTRMADLVREASLVAGKPVALLADLQGAKVRVGRLDREVPIAEGQPVILVGLEVDVRERPADPAARRRDHPGGL